MGCGQGLRSGMGDVEFGERIPVSPETVGGESHPGAGGGREDDDGQGWGAG